MIAKLKQYPMVALLFAIAGGIILARVVIHIANQIFDLYGNPDPWLVIGLLAFVAVAVIGVSSLSGAMMFISNHKRKIGIAVLLIVGLIGLFVHRQSVTDESNRIAAFQQQMQRNLADDASRDKQKQAAVAEQEQQFQKLIHRR